MKALNIRFDRNELSGSFGDIGTSLPLIIGIVAVSGINLASVLIMFGIMQIFTGLRYGIPISVQPLKAFAAIIIAQKLTGNVIFAGGLAIGIIMLVFTLTGLVEWFAKYVPKSVVRGIQFGLGLQLGMLAFKNYISVGPVISYIFAGLAFVIALVLIGNRKYPPAIFIMVLGLLYILFFSKVRAISMLVPSIHFPHFTGDFSIADLVKGFFLLALPQIPLSIGNSILATSQVSKDFFPERAVSVKNISFSYSLMNIICPFFGGIPVCHGSGGLAGNYTFGARTAGSVIIYGSVFIVAGLFFSNNFEHLVNLFPLSLLGIILLFESITLMLLLRDVMNSKKDFFIALIVGVLAVNLPFGYAVALVVGMIAWYIPQKLKVKMTVFGFKNN